MADALRDGNGTPTMMIKDAGTGEIKPFDTSMLASSAVWGEITGEITDQEDLQSALGEKVAGNTAITGATKTKITYDAKGLVTGGADATTADIADSTDKRYCTDAQKTVISNTSNTNTGDETNSTILTKIGYTPESTSNKVTSISGSSTDTQYPSAKLVYDQLALKASLTGTETLTNKRMTKRVYSTTSVATLTPEISTYDIFRLTAQAEAITIANPSTSTPNNGDMMLFEMTCDGTNRAVTLGTAYVSKSGQSLTTLTASKLTTALFIYIADLSKWNLLSVATEA